jgi:hypothetical protein
MMPEISPPAVGHHMRLADLTGKQAFQLWKSMDHRWKFFQKLIKRMEANRWPEHDSFLRDLRIVERLLRDAVLDLATEWSYKKHDLK